MHGQQNIKRTNEASAFALLRCYTAPQLVIDAAGQPVDPIFSNQAVLEIKSVGFPETSLTKHQPTPFNVPEGCSSHQAAAET